MHRLIKNMFILILKLVCNSSISLFVFVNYNINSINISDLKRYRTCDFNDSMSNQYKLIIKLLIILVTVN